MTTNQVRLSELAAGGSGRVARIEAEPDTQRRLLEMGIIRGEVLTVKKVAPLGDPMELIVKGYHLSLRRQESACIFLEL